MSFGLYLAALIFFVAVVWSGRALEHHRATPWVRPLASLQALLTVAGLLIAGLWYFFERPQAAKLNIEIKAEAVSLPNGRVLVLADVGVTNLGTTAINFTRKPYEILVQQVTPLSTKISNEYSDRNTRESPRRMHGGEDWSQLARISSDDEEASLTSFVEAGETENLYFRTILPCRTDLRVYVSARFRKPDGDLDWIFGSDQLYWVKQTFLDLSEKCRGTPPAKTLQP